MGIISTIGWSALITAAIEGAVCVGASAAIVWGGAELCNAINDAPYTPKYDTAVPDDYFHDIMRENAEDEDKKKKGPPKSNIDQNQQATDAKKDIERKTGDLAPFLGPTQIRKLMLPVSC